MVVRLFGNCCVGRVQGSEKFEEKEYALVWALICRANIGEDRDQGVFKDIINPCNGLSKNANFSIKTASD